MEATAEMATTAEKATTEEMPDVKYIQIEGAAFEALKAQFEKLGQCKLNLMFIEQVISKEQERRFKACQLGNQVLMFHGTDANCGTSIEKKGLGVNYSRRAAYGKGNYFSPNPLTSLSYAPLNYDYHCIYVCEVKFGKFGINYNSNGSDIFCAFADEQSNTIYRIGLFPSGHVSAFDAKKALLPAI